MEKMRKISIELVAAAALAGSATMAGAADFGIPVHYSPPAVVEPLLAGGSWYIRGDMGVGIQSMGAWNIGLINHPPKGSVANWLRHSVDDTVIIGGGFGYQFSEWLRGDITAEYRASANFKGADSWRYPPNPRGYNSYTGSLSSTVVLANAYVDLGKHWGLTPFVGAGIGGAYNRLTHVTDIGGGIAAGSVGEFADKGKLNFAWALHAGVSYEVNQNLKLEASYRYLNMGDAETGVITCRPNRCTGGSRLTINDITSNDFRLGARWMLNPVVPVSAPMPVIAKN
jgi:opacity protein-like surface antigen